mgnify:CR=1 FL=1
MTVPSVLGRFLEISLHTPDIQASLEFYESLGFEQASVSETWPEHAAQASSDSAMLWFVLRWPKVSDAAASTATSVRPASAARSRPVRFGTSAVYRVPGRGWTARTRCR